MDDVSFLQTKVDEQFKKAFGRTSLSRRLKDIEKEHMELQRFTDLTNLKEEAGDLLASLFQLANEAGWSVIDMIESNLNKIDRRMLQYRSLSRKKNVAMFGGSFNPPHLGHLTVAKLILNFSREFDEVWLLPNNNSMDGKNLVHSEHRLEMCKLLALYDGRIKVSNYEIANNFCGETFHMVCRLLEEDFAKDEYDFSFVLGLDAANKTMSWPNSEDLIRMMRFVVVSRPGEVVDINNSWFLKPPHIFMGCEEDVIHTSSTIIRKTFWDENRKETSLTKEVEEYIREHRLYT